MGSLENSESSQENLILMDTVQKSMSSYIPMKVDRDDLLEEVAGQLPEDLDITYSIAGKGFLKVIMNGVAYIAEGPGRTGFKDERSLEQPNVESGVGRITVSKRKPPTEV